MHVINILTPVFLFVIIGIVLRLTSFLPSDFFKGCNKLVFYIGLPSFLFSKIASTTSSLSDSSNIFYVLIATMVLSVLLAYLIARLIGIPNKSYSAFVQVSFRGNTALVGIPVIVYTFTSTGNIDLINKAIIALAPAIPIWNITSMFLLGIHQEGSENISIIKIFKRVSTNPLVIACVSGLIVSFFEIKIPNIIDLCCSRLGQMTMPLALISIGASLTFKQLKGKKINSCAAAIIKVFICPVLGLICGHFIGLNDQEMFIALIYCATPTAISAYVMTEQMNGDEQLAGSGVVLSTLLSIISLIVIISIYI